MELSLFQPISFRLAEGTDITHFDMGALELVATTTSKTKVMEILIPPWIAPGSKVTLSWTTKSGVEGQYVTCEVSTSPNHALYSGIKGNWATNELIYHTTSSATGANYSRTFVLSGRSITVLLYLSVAESLSATLTNFKVQSASNPVQESITELWPSGNLVLSTS